MKILLQFEYPPIPAGLSTQGDLLYRGLREIGVDVQAVHWESSQEKEWYYRWFAPDVVLGVGYWGYTPHLVQHPLRFGCQPVPWLVADGFIANYRDELNRLPLILVTSQWVKDVHVRDGISPDIIDVLPVGCDTRAFMPRNARDPAIAAVRASFGVEPDELLILTIGGDGASKGAQEVMQALADIDKQAPKWKYVVKVWPQVRTALQNALDLEMARQLGIAHKVIYSTGRLSRNIMPYLLGACDIYAGPSRLEGFGMPHVEAGASGKPVVALDAMAFRDTLVHGETALLARVARENRITETVLGPESGYEEGHRIVFDPPRIADYRANVPDVAAHLLRLLQDAGLRRSLGESGRERVIAHYDYRVVARQCLHILSRRLHLGAAASAHAVGASSSG